MARSISPLISVSPTGFAGNFVEAAKASVETNVRDAFQRITEGAALTDAQRKSRGRMGPKRTLGGATRPKDSTNLSTARGDVPSFFCFLARLAPVGGFRNARALASRSSPRFATVCCCREGMRGCVEGPEGGLWGSKKHKLKGGANTIWTHLSFPRRPNAKPWPRASFRGHFSSKR